MLGGWIEGPFQAQGPSFLQSLEEANFPDSHFLGEQGFFRGWGGEVVAAAGDVFEIERK